MSWFTKLFGRDKCDRCGVGVFSLPTDHPFTRACRLHDYEFDQAHAGQNNKTRAEVDAELFHRWALIAKNTSTTKMQECDLLLDICRYWPLARKLGHLFWDGKDGSESDTANP